MIRGCDFQELGDYVHRGDDGCYDVVNAFIRRRSSQFLHSELEWNILSRRLTILLILYIQSSLSALV